LQPLADRVSHGIADRRGVDIDAHPASGLPEALAVDGSCRAERALPTEGCIMTHCFA